MSTRQQSLLHFERLSTSSRICVTVLVVHVHGQCLFKWTARKIQADKIVRRAQSEGYEV